MFDRIPKVGMAALAVAERHREEPLRDRVVVGVSPQGPTEIAIPASRVAPPKVEARRSLQIEADASKRADGSVEVPSPSTVRLREPFTADHVELGEGAARRWKIGTTSMSDTGLCDRSPAFARLLERLLVVGDPT